MSGGIIGDVCGGRCWRHPMSHISIAVYKQVAEYNPERLNWKGGVCVTYHVCEFRDGIQRQVFSIMDPAEDGCMQPVEEVSLDHEESPLFVHGWPSAQDR